MYKCLLLVLLFTLMGAAQKNNLHNTNNFSSDYYYIDANRYKLPILNNGTLADLNYPLPQYGKYDSIGVLFSGGFMINGKANGQRWADAQATASLVANFLPGKTGTDPYDPRNNIYVLSGYPFNQEWLAYKYAVEAGADFYDGNHDGLYDPVDLNHNNKWDPTEDSPDIIGDGLVTWCIYNDADTVRQRLEGSFPVGLEIQQTAFAYYPIGHPELDNMIFFRYRLINSGLKANMLDSVYFSIWGDPDIGNNADDLVGCDTLLNSGYCYSNTPDASFGVNPPAMMFALLQGPVSYIPGETFVDNNSNGAYDEGIDTPLDTAYEFRGRLMGKKIFPGAKNLSMTAFTHYQASDPVLGDPNSITDLYNYSLGIQRNGNIVNPCTFPLGAVRGGVNCNLINKKFWYSGDPVTDVGWINTVHTDQRVMVHTGPFKLELNKPVDIITAHVLGRGTTALNSVTIAKENTLKAIEHIRRNFPLMEVDDISEVVHGYNLYQNYPNPFNPSTTIRYSIPAAGNVKLVLFNSLGQEIRVLASGYIQNGVHEVKLNASDLSSGVYFYRLTVTSEGNNNFISTRKLTVIK